MSAWHSRIANQDYLKTPDHHPGVAEVAPATPIIGHSWHATYADGNVLYGTMHPLVTADGAVVPAHADVTYPGTVPAGRP